MHAHVAGLEIHFQYISSQIIQPPSPPWRDFYSRSPPTRYIQSNLTISNSVSSKSPLSWSQADSPFIRLLLGANWVTLLFWTIFHVPWDFEIVGFACSSISQGNLSTPTKAFFSETELCSITLIHTLAWINWICHVQLSDIFLCSGDSGENVCRIILRISGHLMIHIKRIFYFGIYNTYTKTILVYTTQVNSAFRATWLVPLSRDIKYYSPPGGFRRKKWSANPILS